MPKYEWDDPDNLNNFLVDADGKDVFEGVTVETRNGLIVQKGKKNVTYPVGTRFTVKRINVDDGLLLLEHESGRTFTAFITSVYKVEPEFKIGDTVTFVRDITDIDLFSTIGTNKVLIPEGTTAYVLETEVGEPEFDLYVKLADREPEEQRWYIKQEWVVK